ncbi:MAG: OmpH family outer membrane protein [Planctomycetota bacterium]|jgi:Skp family chaperone for outer membrane proteins|nr:OmpH family outer membrane protein [Planctomycetota bacterium]
MRKFPWRAVASCSAWLLCLFPGLAAGEAPQAPETRRIGIVFMQQVFKNYNYARDTEERIKAAFTPEQNRIEDEMKRVEELERALQNNPLKPPGTAQWRKSMMEIEAAKVEIQAMQEDFGKRVKNEEAAFWVNVYNAFQRSCRILAEYYQYDMIIAAPDPAISEDAIKAQDPMAIQQEILMRRIQYVHDRANLTQAITELMNQRYLKYQQDPQKNPL